MPARLIPVGIEKALFFTVVVCPVWTSVTVMDAPLGIEAVPVTVPPLT